MNARCTILGAAILSATWPSAATAQQAGFRFGDNTTSYRYLDPEHAGPAHFRSQQTFNTYYRPVNNGDSQIGPDPDASAADFRVQQMANDLHHQLKTNYRHDLPEYNRRYVHFRTAMQGWNSSDKTDEDLGNMTQFLKTSMKYSMPGSNDFLPPLPIVNPVDLDSDSTHAPGVLDPFRDDPVQTAPM
jgi:hypothetical protein